MKYIFAVALLCIGAVAAQAPAQGNGRALAETLEKRAAALLVRVHQVQQEHRGQFNHLLTALDREAVMVEALALDLKNQVADTTRQFNMHHIHVIEEDLLAAENRVSEEIAIIEHVRTGGDRRGENSSQLVARGQRLVQEGKDAVAKFPNAREVRDINSEIVVIESLIKAIQARPAPTAAELQKDEEELARQERTLRQLIEKATARRPN